MRHSRLADAVCEIDGTPELSASTDHYEPLARERVSGFRISHKHITFDKALIGRTRTADTDDLLQAALVMRAARVAACARSTSSPFPAPVRRRQIEHGDPRLGGESIAECFAQSAARSGSPGAVRASDRAGPLRQQRAITSFNRNWQNRMGSAVKALASPVVVAAPRSRWDCPAGSSGARGMRKHAAHRATGSLFKLFP